MKLYWRYKKDGKWTWRPATGAAPDLHLAEFMLMAKEEEE